jgi:hypothetical protein
LAENLAAKSVENLAAYLVDQMVDWWVEQKVVMMVELMDQSLVVKKVDRKAGQLEDLMAGSKVGVLVHRRAEKLVGRLGLRWAVMRDYSLVDWTVCP